QPLGSATINPGVPGARPQRRARDAVRSSTRERRARWDQRKISVQPTFLTLPPSCTGRRELVSEVSDLWVIDCTLPLGSTTITGLDARLWPRDLPDQAVSPGAKE